MTSITSLSQFLNSQTSSNSSNSSTSALLSNSLKSSLATTATSSTDDGDSVTLSAAAQALLAKSSSSSNSSTKNYGFTLTAKQQEQLESVLANYKDKPQNQANYDAIQKDLKKYRLDTVNMGAKDSATSFNIKSILFSILNGKDVSNGTAERAQALATKKSAYAEQIVADWAAVRAASTTTATETTT